MNDDGMTGEPLIVTLTMTDAQAKYYRQMWEELQQSIVAACQVPGGLLTWEAQDAK